MKRKNKHVGKPVFFVVVALILLFSVASFFGFENYHGDVREIYFKGAKDIRWGIDINGGVEAIYSPDKEVDDITDEDMDSAKQIIETRLLGQGITDSEVYTDYSNHQLIVRFAAPEGLDPQQAVKSLGDTAVLSFYKGEAADESKLVLRGANDIAGATAGYDQESNQYCVNLELTASGKEKFAAATAEMIGKQISIYMDDQMLSAPTVNDVITNGNAMITGNYDAESAAELASKINAGSLPFGLTNDTSKLQVISPMLGKQSLQVMLIAGIAAFAVICILMIFRYRLCGVIACLGLLGQAAGMIACASGFFPETNSYTLTLPGIAGIILSIGFGVDANVIIIERIKEEFRKGKTIDGAITQGYSNAFSSILDGNATNIIVAIVLIAAFGTPDSFLTRIFNLIPFMSASVTGSIYSFGVTLITGVIFNFVMGIFATRLMLMSISRFKALRNPWLYGGEKSNA